MKNGKRSVFFLKRLPFWCISWSMRKYKEYSDEDIVKYAKEVKSIAGLLRKLNLKVAGGNYANLKKKIQQLNINTQHWTGKAWNKDTQLKNWSEYTRGRRLKKYVIKERGHQCEICKYTQWLGQMISLEIHHIDGDQTNNDKNNLQLLCPNCHSFTDTYCKSKSDL